MRKKLTVKLDGEKYDVEVVEVTPHQIGVIVNGRLHKVEIEDLPSLARNIETPPALSSPASKAPGPTPAQPGQIVAPLPGEIVEINVKVGDHVETGQVFVVLEAMKMKNKIRAAHPGLVSAIEVEKGDSVEYGQILVRLEEEQNDLG